MKSDLTVPAIGKETKVDAVEDDVKSESSRDKKLSLEPALHSESTSRPRKSRESGTRQTAKMDEEEKEKEMGKEREGRSIKEERETAMWP